MTTTEPTRERVEAYEKALGCDQPPAGALAAGAYGLCYHHDEVRDDAGCPVAVDAARVEAEYVAEVEAQRDALYREATHLRRYRDRALAAEAAARL